MKGNSSMIPKYSSWKKFACLLITFAMFLQLIAFHVNAENSDIAVTVQKGDTVQLVITNTYGPTNGAQPSKIFVFYDTDVFEYVSISGYGNFIDAEIEFKWTATKNAPFIPGDAATTGGTDWVDRTSGLWFNINQWRGSTDDSKGDVAILNLRVKSDADLDSLGSSFAITAKSQDGGRGTPPSGYITVTPSQITVSDDDPGGDPTIPGEIDVVADYGGAITYDDTTGAYTIATTIDNYVIDKVVVDGQEIDGVQGATEYSVGAGNAPERSIVALFA
jgi:hypothetical protein